MPTTHRWHVFISDDLATIECLSPWAVCWTRCSAQQKPWKHSCCFLKYCGMATSNRWFYNCWMGWPSGQRWWLHFGSDFGHSFGVCPGPPWATRASPLCWMSSPGRDMWGRPKGLYMPGPSIVTLFFATLYLWGIRTSQEFPYRRLLPLLKKTKQFKSPTSINKNDDDDGDDDDDDDLQMMIYGWRSTDCISLSHIFCLQGAVSGWHVKMCGTMVAVVESFDLQGLVTFGITQVWKDTM